MNKNWVMVDVEADGPCPGLYSMIELGAVHVTTKQTFYTTLRPFGAKYIQASLDVTGHTHEETLTFKDSTAAMTEFAAWLKSVCPDNPQFISDNNGFDWQFVNYYFHVILGNNPFGFSSQNLGSLYKGMKQDIRQNFKHLRKTAHTHNPVDDACGNAEAMLAMAEQGFKF